MVDPIYATVAKVSSLLQIPTRSASTNPTEEEVKDLIKTKEDEIDNDTGHAWRIRYSGTKSGQDTTQRYETYDFDGRHEYYTGVPIYLKHRMIRQFSASDGDAIEFWNGSEYEDWLADKTEGRGKDYWVDYARGIFYVRGYLWNRKPQGFRFKYRYGDTFLNLDIEDICKKLAAIDFLTGMDPRSFPVQEGGGASMDHSTRVDKWQKQVDDKLQRYKEWQVPSISQ